MTDTQTDTGVMVHGSKIKSSVLNTVDKLLLTNRTGGNAVTGDVLALDTANNASFVFGVDTLPYSPAFVVPSDIGTGGVAVSKTIANAAPGWVYKSHAYVPLANVSAAVSIGEYLKFSGTSKNFVGTGVIADNSGVPPSLAKAIALNSAAGSGQIPVLLLPLRPWLNHTCRVYNDANEALTASQVLPVTFNSTRWDPLNMHDAAGTDSKIIIPSTLAGSAPFLVSGHGYMFVAGGVVAAYFALRLNGTTVVAKQGTSGNGMTNVQAIVSLAATEYVELIAYTTSAGANVMAVSAISPELSITQLGGAYLV